MQRRNDFTFDSYTIGKDVLKEWMLIILVALIAFFVSFSVQATNYRETYTMSTTFTVNSKNYYNSMYNDLNSASDTATRFQQIINSSILQKQVAKDLGLEDMPGEISASIVEGTNLLTLTVTEEDPSLSYRVMKSIMENYNTISENIVGDVVLTVLEAASIPEKPDRAFSPWKTMGMTFVATVIVMIVLLVLASAFKDTVRKEKEVEAKLDTVLLGSLYHEDKSKWLKGHGKKKQKTSILMTNPTVSFRYVECMKKIATRVSNKMDHRGAKTLLITSVGENEGKSTVAANLALALSEENKRVLLIDADLRKPAQYKIFDVDSGDYIPLGDVLNKVVTKGNFIYRKPGTNLRLLLNMKAYENSTEMLSGPMMKRILNILRMNLDYIILDSSPMTLVADSEELMPMMDAALLVVRQHISHVRDINDVIDILNYDGEKLLGCVFNDVGGAQYTNHGYYGYDGNSARGGYSKNYGHYYGRGVDDGFDDLYRFDAGEEGSDE